MRQSVRHRLLLLIATLLLTTTGHAAVQEIRLEISRQTVTIDGRQHAKITINRQLPGPVLRFREGDEAVIRVSNRLDVPTAIHWHGLLLPGVMDGVPALNGFPGIAPGETFTYRFPLRQSGTYWYHAHAALQEQEGVYGGIVVLPAGSGDTADADVPEHVLLLSDFHPDRAEHIMHRLKSIPGYYNQGRRTLGDLVADARRDGWGRTLRERLDWARMRMDPTDLTDVGGYTFLVNGQSPQGNWTGLFTPGKPLRLRLINASAMSFFDFRIPGLRLDVVAADGRDVVPVTVDELRIAPAETYDLLVTPSGQETYGIVAEPIDRSGFALATLAVREGLRLPPPEPRRRTELTMADMGAHGGMHAGHSMTDQATAADDTGGDPHAGHDDAHTGHDTGTAHASGHDPDHAAHGDHGDSGHSDSSHDHHASPQAPVPASGHDIHAGHALPDDRGNNGDDRPLRGWAAADVPAGHRQLDYADLRSLRPQADQRAPSRTIEVRLGGDMERYVWTINGRGHHDAEPIRLRYGERVRLRFVNDTMMAHPMHLHGLFFQLENGADTAGQPDKHTVTVPPGASYNVLLTADEPGEWIFHCHLLFHMASGMMSTVVIARVDDEAGTQAADHATHARAADHAGMTHDHAGHQTHDQPATDSGAPAAPTLAGRLSAQHDELHHAGLLRLDQSADSERMTRWEGRFRIGDDRNRLLLRSEGERDRDGTTHNELQLLASHALAPFWDLQAGLRADIGPDARTRAVIGIEGLAPGRFDTELHAFIGSGGDVSLRLHQSLDVLITQKLVLQPLLELEAGLDEDRDERLGRGLRSSELGLRLRYDLRRELSPYVEWVRERSHGDTASQLKAAGDRTADSGWQFGLQWRF